MRLITIVSTLLFFATGIFVPPTYRGHREFEYSSKLDGPNIESFTAVPDCVFPDPHRRLLSYRVTTNVFRIRIDAIHRGGRVRPFHTAGGRTAWPSLSATGVIDPLAAADVEAYVLTATGERGVEVSRRIAFRYRRAEFNLVPPALHTRDTSEADHFTRYESHAHVMNVDSISCSFRFDTAIGGESGRAGLADIFRAEDPIARCHIRWRNVRKARAAGTVEWVARVTDPCTQGRITRTAHVNAIP